MTTAFRDKLITRREGAIPEGGIGGSRADVVDESTETAHIYVNGRPRYSPSLFYKYGTRRRRNRAAIFVS